MYVTHNPPSVKVCCFITGMALTGISIAALAMPGTSFTPIGYLVSLYHIFFGLVICICDGKESWFQYLCNIQERLFSYCSVLATQTGRALFYFYVGSTTLFLLPSGFLFPVLYVIVGGSLTLLGLVMLCLDWCGETCCGPGQYRDMDRAAGAGS